MDQNCDWFSLPDTPPLSVNVKPEWPSAEAHKSPSQVDQLKNLKILVDTSCSAQPPVRYRMPFLGSPAARPQSTPSQAPSSSLNGSREVLNSSEESDNQEVSDWNPMKEDFMSTSFNSYDKGPGANLVGGGAPKQVLQASGEKIKSREHQVYVMGIPKEMQEEAVFNLFSKAGTVREVTVKGASLFSTTDCGYGFVTFTSIKEVETAIRLLDGFPINNSVLRVKPSMSKNDREKRRPAKEVGVEGASVEGRVKSDGLNGTEESYRVRTPSLRTGNENGDAGRNEKDESGSSGLGRKVTLLGDVRRVMLDRASYTKKPGSSPGVSPESPAKQSPQQETMTSRSVTPAKNSGKDGKCPKPCMYCKKGGVMFCSRCKAPYCSHECQKKHWPEHKFLCKPDQEKQDTTSPRSVSPAPRDVSSPAKSASPSPSKQCTIKEKVGLVQDTPKAQGPKPVARKLDLGYQPIPDDPAFKVLVTEVISPDAVWCQVAQESNLTCLSDLMVAMNQYYSDPSIVTEAVAPQKGDLVAAQFSADGGWYRAEVTEIDTEGGAQMHFVDFGNEENMPPTRLRKLTQEMKQLPRQALKCCVAGIEPVDAQTGWSSEAIKVVISKLLNKKCLVQYEKSIGNVHHIWVTDPSAESGSTVNDFMVKSRYAKSKITTKTAAQPSTPLPSPQDKHHRSPIMVTHLPVREVPETETFTVMCSYFETPGSFYVQILDQDELQELSSIMLKINGTCRELAYIPFQPEIGEVVCAFYNADKCWYRAVVREVQQNAALVQYADFGNSELIQLSLLREYVDAKLPLQAIHCKLTGTVPLDEKSGWSQSEKELFCVAVEGKQLGVKLVGVVDNLYEVELFDQGTKKCVHQELIKQGCGRAIEMKTDSDVPVTPQPQLPSKLSLKLESDSIQPGMEMICNVTLVESPNELWIQVAKNAEAVIQLQEGLNKYYEKLQLHEAFVPTVGQICAACFTADKNWYRAVVTQMGQPSPKHATVFYCDFGNFEDVDVSNLRPLADEYTKLNAQAVRCSLSGIKPLDSKWSSEVISSLKDAIESNLAEVHFGEKVHGVFRVEMFSLDEREMSLNEILVKIGFASPSAAEAQSTNQKDTLEPVYEQCANQQQDIKSPDQKVESHDLGSPNNQEAAVKSPISQSPTVKPKEEEQKSDLAPKLTNQKVDAESQDSSETNQVVELKKTNLPDTGNQSVCVTHVVSPSEFYVQLVTEDTALALADLMTAVNTHYLSQSPISCPIQAGQLCCAKFSQDQAWYRAVVVDRTAGSKVKVQFVDFGNFDEISQEDVQPLDEKFASTPILAIACGLSGVTGTLEGGQWAEETVQAFTEEILNKQCLVRVVGKTANVSKVELFSDGCEDASINQLLIAAELAVPEEDDDIGCEDAKSTEVTSDADTGSGQVTGSVDPVEDTGIVASDGLDNKMMHSVVTGVDGALTELEVVDQAADDRVIISDTLVENGHAVWKEPKMVKADELPGPGADKASSIDVSVKMESSVMETLLKENIAMRALMESQQKQIQQMLEMLKELRSRKQ